MTYKEYMANHRDADLSWCKCYTNADRTHFLVIHEGIAESISAPDTIAHRYGGCDWEAELEKLAREVNPDYDLYSGWTDQHIALEKMHEVGCFFCPFKDECDAMLEEMEETDYGLEANED